MATIRSRVQLRLPSSTEFCVDTFPTRHQRLLAALASVPDPRDRRGIRYGLVGVLAVAVTAALAGCGSFAAIGQWAAESSVEMLVMLGLNRGRVPDESTLRKLFARLDADALDAALGVWMFTRTFLVDERRVIGHVPSCVDFEWRSTLILCSGADSLGVGLFFGVGVPAKGGDELGHLLVALDAAEGSFGVEHARSGPAQHHLPPSQRPRSSPANPHGQHQRCRSSPERSPRANPTTRQHQTRQPGEQ